MKHRAIILALASAGIAFPVGARAADDICGRLIIQAINQICQLLPNGLSLCQPVALVGPGAECKNPEQQSVVRVPLGQPTLRAMTPWGPQVAAPLAPWAAPYPSPLVPMAAAAPMVAAMPPAASAAPETVVASPTPPTAIADAAPAEPAVTEPVPTPAAPVPSSTPVATPVPPAVSTVAADIAPTTAASMLTGTPAPASTPSGEAATAPTPEAVAPTTPAAATPVDPAVPPVTVVTTDAASSSPAPAISPAVAETGAMIAPVAAGPAPDEDAAKADALAHFDFDSANLTEAGRAVLDAWLAAAPKDKTIRVSGHADRLGPEPYNLKLSLRRAEAVKQYLVGKGMDPRRVELEARGESDPVKRCKGDPTPATKACLAPNRRVVIDPE